MNRSVSLARHRIGGPLAALALVRASVAYASEEPSAPTTPPLEAPTTSSGSPAPSGSASDVVELGPAPSADLPAEQRTAEDLARDHSPVDVTIFAGERGKRITGSAHKVSKEELERFEDDDIHRTLMRVPGVYVRGEDGYGLRPNIGLRGASSDRSKKITLMEDGVLMAPAPYSAPAAYYFPLATRLTGVEVYKGPAALRYGPNSIGGAVNLLTRSVPMGHRFGADLAMGSQLYAKQHLHYGYGTRHAGLLLEVARIRTDGFKVQEGARPLPLGNTGFEKAEAMLKARVNSDPDAHVYHELRLKLGVTHERSNETYLGLTENDFRASPWRRYAASALDQMSYRNTLGEVTYSLVVGGVLQLATTLYRHDLSRAWFKLNSLAGSEVLDVLANPGAGQNAIDYAILTGAEDSLTQDQRLLIGTNDRVFVSQGIQTTGQWTPPKLGRVSQKIQFGFRVHQDSVRRLHTEDGYFMRATTTGGLLVRDATPRAITEHNVGSALALSAHLVDEVSAFGAILAPGVRTEVIETTLADRRTGVITRGTQQVLLPGVGALYEVARDVFVLGGVHQGFSPASPGQGSGVQPELAVNYELGTRATYRKWSGELIGFFSDYSNLTGECTFSSGCPEGQVDTQFNAGQAQIGGLEAGLSGEVTAPRDLRFPLRVGYTFTATRFMTGFTSDNPQWGDVEEGDELPYVPKHQLSVTGGMDWGTRAGLTFGVTYVDSMREVAGQGTPLPFDRTDAFAVLDASAFVRVLPEVQLYVRGENLLDNAYVVSHRPFGARPGQPRLLFAGVKIDLDRR
ncbi:MAG: TonB-dependent receptor [Deltaproteobacteria bacterium]|nr:TonB-dependent receptor [Deltaproteobacteria bacterium]